MWGSKKCNNNKDKDRSEQQQQEQSHKTLSPNLALHLAHCCWHRFDNEMNPKRRHARQRTPGSRQETTENRQQTSDKRQQKAKRIEEKLKATHKQNINSAKRHSRNYWENNTNSSSNKGNPAAEIEKGRERERTLKLRPQLARVHQNYKLYEYSISGICDAWVNNRSKQPNDFFDLLLLGER